MTELASRWNFAEVNELIDRHNRWFPIESRLPLDPRTGDYVLVNGEHYGKAPLDARWVLERFPPGQANGRPPRAEPAERSRQEVGESVPAEARERSACRGAGHVAERPGAVHDPESERLGEPDRLGPVRDQRNSRRVEGAERDRSEDDEQCDPIRGRGRPRARSRRRSSRRGGPDRQQPSAAIREAPEQRVDCRLEQAADEEDGADRERVESMRVELQRDQHHEQSEEEGGEGVQPETAEEAPVVLRAPERAGNLRFRGRRRTRAGRRPPARPRPHLQP